MRTFINPVSRKHPSIVQHCIIALASWALVGCDASKSSQSTSPARRADASAAKYTEQEVAIPLISPSRRDIENFVSGKQFKTHPRKDFDFERFANDGKWLAASYGIDINVFTGRWFTKSVSANERAICVRDISRGGQPPQKLSCRTVYSISDKRMAVSSNHVPDYGYDLILDETRPE